MMIGPMKKKIITASVLTATVLIVIFAVISAVFLIQNNKKIAALEERGEVVQRYVFTQNMVQGDVVTASDLVCVDVKGESAPVDSYMENELAGIIGRRLKVNANAKTIVTDSLFFTEDKEPSADMRMQEFNMITLPSDLEIGDYIDVRMRFPTGEDYLVIAGKRIENLGAAETESNTIFLQLDEEEIVRMGSAIIESYIRDGVHLYANKYVDPDAQLFAYDRVNYVEKFENARYYTKTESITEEISGEIIEDTVEEKVEREVSEIASIIGLNVQETENIKQAVDSNETDTIDYYKDFLVVTEKSIEENYPVKAEVATLMRNNPNILSEIKSKYNVEKLEQDRINFLDTNLTYIDDYTGELMTNDDYIASIKENLDKEIEAQRTERQEYLLNLLMTQE